MEIMKFFVVFLFLLVDFLEGRYDLEKGFTTEEKQRIVDLHNHFRAKVARGEVPGLPSAANMLAVSWEDRVAEKAQFWADICLPVHDAPHDRAVKPYNKVGQNLAHGASVNEALLSWFAEYKTANYVSFDQSCDNDGCEQFKQLIWWKSWNLGCGQSQCTGNQNGPNLVCNYAPSGNVEKIGGGKAPVFEEGLPCSKCPNGFGYCMAGALCASTDQCFTTNTPCNCTISTCENGGLFDDYTCSCLCQKGFKGLRCEELCVDQDDFCELQKEDCAWNSRYNEYTRTKCEKTCNSCGPLENMDGLNRDGIVTNVYDLTEDLDCINKASDRTCEEQPGVCTPMSAWAAENCARYCGICKGSGRKPPTTPTPRKPHSTKSGKYEKQPAYSIDEKPYNDERTGTNDPASNAVSGKITLSSVMAIVLVFFIL